MSAHSSEPIRSAFVDDPEMFELVEMFVDEMPDRVSSLVDAWGESEREMLQRIAHQLKGSCAGYGFAAVGKCAAEFESVLRDASTDLDAIRQEFDALVAMCNRVVL